MTVPIAFETTPFFGREDELRALDSLFASGVRIALLSGPPGIGKSRLAFEFAERMFPSRWWFSSSLSEGAALDERSQRLAVDSDLAGPSLILNGDTLFEPAIARQLLAAPEAPITVTIDRKARYDDDDMKVTTEGDHLRAIGKKLPRETVNGESIGFLRFNAAGAATFVAELERTMRTLDGTSLWYLSAINRLAGEGVDVRCASIEGLQWAELDYLSDLERCRQLATGWVEAQPR